LKEEKMRGFKIIMTAVLLLVVGCAGSTNFTSAKVYYYKNEDFVKAEDFASKATVDEPDNWEAHLILALAQAKLEKYAEAEKAFSEAHEIAPENKKEDVYNLQHAFFVENYNKGITENATMNYEGAAEYFEKAVTIEPGYPKGHINLGVAYSMMKEQDKALASFKRAVEADSTSVDGWRNLGITYQSMGEFVLAGEAFTKVVELAPDDIDGLFSLGDMHFNQKEFEKALQNYNKAAETRSDDAALQYQIGASYFSLQDYANATQAFQKAAALSKESDPSLDDPDIRDLYKDAMFNLGIAYIKLEEYEAAVSTFERVLEFGETAELHDMLGATYSKMGMKDKAMEEFERAKELSGE
jgi:tetratricopeptide (TPR) repeat protein